MGRPRDAYYWDQVTQEGNGMWKCKHCKREFKGGVSRIKAHLGTETGKGIALCNPSVRDNEGVDSTVMVNSSNPPDAVYGVNSSEVARHASQMIDDNIFDSSNHQSDTCPSDIFEGRAQMEDVTGSGSSGFESETRDIKELIDKLSCEENDIKGGGLQWLESRGKKRRREVSCWLETTSELITRADRIRESLPKGWSANPSEEIRKLTCEVQQHMKKKLLVLSGGLVGERFEKNIKKIWELLGDDQVFIIGVQGMGGVGKTCLVTHIKNEITRKGSFNFKHVFWVTASQDSSVFKLQDDIAKKIGVKFDEDDERIRAEILSSALEDKDKSVLILDDVWNYIDLHKVGIPLKVNGNKLIMTSRLKHVCHQMDCNDIIEMEPLHWPDDLLAIRNVEKDDEFQEAWDIFVLNLGYHGTPATIPGKVLKTAESVVKNCGGLPLALSVMARIMKGVNEIHRWKYALNGLKNSIMEEEIFKILKRSYDHLPDENMQKCFIYCALLSDLCRKELIMYFVDEGLINGMSSLKKIFVEGHTILDKLVEHSLLKDTREKGNKVIMHGLVRDMACHIVRDRYRYMVKNNKRCRHMVKNNTRLTKIPGIQEWTADLEKVYLVENEIDEIPETTSPLCPRLSTLIWHNNSLRSIPDCFFNHMSALAILNLSHNTRLTSLPISVSNLRSLVSLELADCAGLKYVPPLGQLQKLSRLVISRSSIEQVPKGIESLINLKWLDLSANSKLVDVPGWVLQALTNMQYLDIWSKNIKVEVEDIQRMSKLQCFAGSFLDGKNLSDYVRNARDKGCGPQYYHLRLGDISVSSSGSDLSLDKLMIEDKRRVEFGDCEEQSHLLPRDLEELNIIRNMQWRCLCDAVSFYGPSLSSILISNCSKVESVFCLNASCSLCTHIRELQSLHLRYLKRLAVIWKEQAVPRCEGFFNLSRLEVEGCHKMEKLLTPVLLKQLPNLMVIEVRYCNSMKEIFAMPMLGSDSTVELPKLTTLQLGFLPLLKTVGGSRITYGSYKKFSIIRCPKLERERLPALVSESGVVIEFTFS